MPIIRPYKGIYPQFSDKAFIAENAAIIGDVKIGDFSSIWYGCVLRGDINNIVIGKNTNVQDGTVIHVDHKKYGTIIGDNVTIGHMAMLHACTLEDCSFIGMKACVMDGVVVEKHAMVAAGAVVTHGKRIPSGELWSGVPAKFLRKLRDDEIENIMYSANHYVKICEGYKN